MSVVQSVGPSASEEEKKGFMGALHMYFGGTEHRGQEGILRSGNQGPCCSTITISVVAFVADSQCF